MEDEDDDEDNKDENEQRVYQTSKATTTTTTSTATTYRARDVSCLDIIGQQQKITRSGRCDQMGARCPSRMRPASRQTDEQASRADDISQTPTLDHLAGLLEGKGEDASMLRYLSEVVNRESQSDSAAEHQRTHTSETAPVDAAKTRWFDDAPENIRRIAIATRAREEYEE